MAIIKLKRIKAERGSQTINAGELAIAGTRLYYGGADIDVNATGITPTQVAGTNISNTFSQNNTFNGGNLTLQVAANKEITFQNTAGNLSNRYYVGPDGYLRTNIVNGNLTGTMLVNADYVNEKLQGLDVKDSVIATSTENIPGTYTTTNGGTFTFTNNGSWTPDGVTLSVGSRVLLKNQTNNYNNGIYKVITLGAPGVATVLQRTDDANTMRELSSAFVFIEGGALFADTGWTCTIGSTTTTTPGVDAVIPWTQFSGAGTYKADETSLHLNGNTFEIMDGAVTPGNFTVGGDLAIGAGSTTWSIDGLGTDMVFTSGGYTATLPAPNTARHTIAYTTDIPAGVDVITCATATYTAAKVVDVPNFVPADGKQLYIKFTHTNAATPATLTVTGSGVNALPLYWGPFGTANPGWGDGDVLRIECRGSPANAWYILENLTTGTYYGRATTLANPQNFSITGDVTAANIAFNGSGAVALSSSIAATTVTGKALTGFSPASGTIAATDSILQAINKLAYDKHIAVTLATNSGLAISAQTLNMGTPSSVTETSTNSVTSGTHTHKVSGLTTSNLDPSAGILNTQLANSSIAIGGQTIALGAAATTTLTGMTLTSPIINDIKASSASASLDLWSESTTAAITMFNAKTTGVINIAGGALSSGTKTINLGLGGTTGGTTIIAIGSANGTFSTSLNGVLKTNSAANTSGSWDTSMTAPTGTQRLNYSGWLYATQFEGIIDGGTTWA